MKMSSRLALASVIRRMALPARLKAKNTARQTPSSPSVSRVTWQRSAPSGRTSTDRMWSRGARISRVWASPASTVRSTAAEPEKRRSKFSGVSQATRWPLEMMRMVWHTAWTSERMWLLRMTVCFWPRDWIRERISMICLGSRPTVGSSRITTSGSPSRAWAMPTRWR